MPPIFPVSTVGGGVCFGFPDVCKIPAPPAPFAVAPFPNFGQVNQAKKTSKKVLACKKKVCVKPSQMNRSQGDEGGTLKGIKSMKNMDKVKYKKASGAVKAEGKPVVYFTSMTEHNGPPNANFPPGMQIAPSQVKVLVSP